MKKCLIHLLFFTLFFSVVISGASANTFKVPTQKYLMSFNVCLATVADCNNPQNHFVLLAQSDDGKSWSLLEGWNASKGSVPDLFRRGNTIYLYDTQGLTKIDVKTGEITKTRVSITSGESFVDPSLAQLPDGRLILFYLPGMRGGDPAQCAAGETTCQKMIKSAVEVAGSDGTSFVEDPGMRVSATLSSTGQDQDRVFSDPDIFFNGTDWVLYVSRGAGTQAYTSKDIQGSYSNKVNLTNGKGGVPSGILDEGSSKVWTYTHADVAGERVIRRSVSDKGLSGASNDSDYQTIIATSFVSSLGYKIVGSPGVAINNVGIECQVCNPKPTPTPRPTPTPTPTPTATPMASVSPPATPVATPIASAIPASSPSVISGKKVTITCVKGKQTKKVSGANPKCPQGFKKK